MLYLACMQASGRAARVLSYLLADNDQCKETLLTILPQTSAAADTDMPSTGPWSQFLQVVSAACNGKLWQGRWFCQMAVTDSLHVCHNSGPHELLLR